MGRLITLDDFIDTYAKLNQRGLSFITSKFNFSEIKRAKTAFNHLNIEAANWWVIPKVRERWNLLVTKNKDIYFEEFAVTNYLHKRNNLKMLSLGSGSCTSELKFANYSNFSEILCTDIAETPLNHAKTIAKKNNLKNIEFQILDANNISFPENHYDIIYFKASLHHFKNVEQIIGTLVRKTLKKDGYLIIDEFVGPNRLQFSVNQIKEINKAIDIIPKQYRKRFKINLLKNKIYGSGLMRMILADPSECIDSASIIPSIRQHFNIVYEAGYGGNIVQLALKDIAHHFIELNTEKETVLKDLFDFEDKYLENNPSDFVFGIYSKKNN